MTIDQLLKEIRALRLARDQADAALLLRLVEIERDYADLIRESGAATFSQFLKVADSLVDPSRYEGFKAGLKRIGVEAALACGSDATIEAGLATSKKASRVYVQSIQDWRAEHKGTFPTRQTARNILRQVDPRQEIPESTRRQNEAAELRAEVSQLRAENNALKRKIAKLESQLQGKKAA